jgi:hypothetical protein
MTDRCLDRVADDFVLARQSLAERDAAIARVRAHFDDDTPLDAVDVRTLLADHARAQSLVTQLQERLRGEKHHHENDVQRLQELLGRVVNEARAALEQEKHDGAWVLDRIRRNLGTPTGRSVSIHAREVRAERDALRALASPDKRAIATRPDEAPERLHTLTAGCWCEPASALDGHVNEDGTAARLDLDDTRRCPVERCCATCGTEDDLAVGTAVSPVGVHCVTLCGACAEKGDVRCGSWGAAMSGVLAHCEHLGCDLDEAAAAIAAERVEAVAR